MLDEVAKVLTFGTNRYRDRNWEVGMCWGRPLAGAQRHFSAWMQGRRTDEKTELGAEVAGSLS